MRTTLLLAAAVLAGCAVAYAVDSGNPASPAPPTDEAVIGLCGERLVKVFRRFGMPEDLIPNREEGDNNDSVTLDYGNFGFRERKKTVFICYFWKGWPGTIRGVKIGDTRDACVKTLGSTYSTATNADGTTDYGWQLKDDDVTLWAVFAKDDTLQRIQIQPK